MSVPSSLPVLASMWHHYNVVITITEAGNGTKLSAFINSDNTAEEEHQGPSACRWSSPQVSRQHPILQTIDLFQSEKQWDPWWWVNKNRGIIGTQTRGFDVIE